MIAASQLLRLLTTGRLPLNPQQRLTNFKSNVSINNAGGLADLTRYFHKKFECRSPIIIATRQIHV